MTRRTRWFGFLLISLLLIGQDISFGKTMVPPAVRASVSDGRPVWVFLTDKGPDSHTAKLAGRQFISERAARRESLRGRAIPASIDWPVYAPYRAELEAAGLQVRTESPWFNAISGIVDARALDQMAALPFVKEIRIVQSYVENVLARDVPPPALKPSAGDASEVFDYGPSAGQLKQIQVDRVHEAGLDGKGVFLCFMDTGFDLSHPAFDSLKLIAKHDFINGDDDVGDNDLAQMGHGTSTLSCAAGLAPGHLIGVAPRAEYAVAKTEIQNQEIRVEEEDYWISGLTWATDVLGCDLVSSSLGYILWHTQSELDGNTALATIAADLAAAKGLLVINSAGNEGSKTWRYMIVPADGDSVLAVGAVDPNGNRVYFSSTGPTADGRIKPDVMALGSGVYTAIAGGESYAGNQGTSFSAPLAAGVCALLLQHEPTLTPWQIIDRLRSTATMANDPDTLMGWGIIQAADAINIGTPTTVSDIEVWPNPTPDGRIKIVTPDSARTEPTAFQVITISGRTVYKGEFTGSLGTWDGHNMDGEPVASGIYLLHVRTPQRDEVLKVAVLRE